VLDEVCGALVDDDEFDFGGEFGVETAGDGDARVAGTENDDTHGRVEGPDGKERFTRSGVTPVTSGRTAAARHPDR
jgi:hypothetical protein